MKIRLQIAAGNHCSEFEHAGPTVRIGRDPQGELVLTGEACTGVSRAHARIDLTPEGASVRDAGSSNGTLVNDKLIKVPVRIVANDCIGLGYTGPKLTVAELDLVPDSPAPPRRGWWILALVGLTALAALAVISFVVAYRY